MDNAKSTEMKDVSSPESVSDSEEDINILLGKFIVQQKQQVESQNSPPSLKPSDAQEDEENASYVAIKIESQDSLHPQPQINKIYSSHTVYSVVCLIDEGNAIYSVPNTWLEDPSIDATNCLWPLESESNFIKAVEDMTPPDEDWDLVPVKVLAQSRTLRGAKAREKYYENKVNKENLEETSKAKASKYFPKKSSTSKEKPVDTSTIIANKKKQAERRRAEMERPSTSTDTISKEPNRTLGTRCGKRLRDKDSDSDSEDIQVLNGTDKCTDNQIPLQLPGPHSLDILKGDILKTWKKVKEAGNESEIQTNSEEASVRRKSKRSKKLVSYECNDKEEADTVDSNAKLKTIKELPPVSTASPGPTIIQFEKNVETSSNYVSTELGDSSILSLSSESSSHESAGISAKLDIIVGYLAKLVASIKEVIDNQCYILSHIFPIESEHLNSEGLPIPCETVEDVNKTETWLQQSLENELLMVKSLALLGGKTTKQITSNIIGRIFSNDLALSYNWTGKGGKQALRDLVKTISVIIRIVRRNVISANATDAEIITLISNWFRFAKDRGGGRDHRRSIHQSL